MRPKLDIRTASLTPEQKCYMLALADQRIRTSPRWLHAVERVLGFALVVGTLYLAWVVLA